jgi:hypothetical protein
MTFDDLHLDEDVRQFVKELDGRKQPEAQVQREQVRVETKTLTGKAAEMYDRSLTRSHNVVNPNSNNDNPNAP